MAVSVQLNGIAQKGAVPIIDPRAGELAYKQAMRFSVEHGEVYTYSSERIIAMLDWQSCLVDSVASFVDELGKNTREIQQLNLIYKASRNMEKSVRDFANSTEGTERWHSNCAEEDFRPVEVLKACESLKQSNDRVVTLFAKKLLELS